MLRRDSPRDMVARHLEIVRPTDANFTSNDNDDETVARGRYVYRAIATNLDELSDSALVHWNNQRGETSENRLKELRSDFAATRLPCGDFDVNAAWLMLSSIAYNLFALMRMVLPNWWSTTPYAQSTFASV